MVWRPVTSRESSIFRLTRCPAQLLLLANAKLVQAQRDGRSIIYSVNFDAMRDLLVFLTEDCCGLAGPRSVRRLPRRSAVPGVASL